MCCLWSQIPLQCWIFVYPVVCFFVLFMCFLPFAFDMSNCRGKTRCKVTYCTAGCSAFGGRLLQSTCLPKLPSKWFVSWRGWHRWWVADYHGRLNYSTLPLFTFSCPHCAVSLWGFVLIISHSEKKKKSDHHLTSRHPSSLASQSRCSSPAHIQQGAGSHLQQCLIDHIV